MNSAPAVGLTIGVGQDVDDSEVATEVVSNRDRGFLLDEDGLVDEELTFAMAEDGLGSVPGDSSSWASLVSRRQAIDAEGAIAPVGVAVEGHTAQEIEGSKPCPFASLLVGISYLPDHKGSLDASKTELLPKPMVGSALERKPMGDLLGESNLGEGVARLIKACHHLEEGFGIPLCSHHSGEFHRPLIITQGV